MTEDASGETRDASRPRLEIDWLKTVAGALAAVSSAVVLSTLGAAGTLIGAAVGSVVLTVGNALYSQGLEHSRQRLTRAQRAALRDVGVADSAVRRAERNLEDGPPGDTSDGPPDGWRDRLTQLPWKRIALVAGALFVTSVVLITAFELLAGRSVASYTGGSSSTGGTSLTRLGGGDPEHQRDQQQSPSDGGTPTGTPSDQASDEPSTGSSDTPEVEPSTPLPESTDPGLSESATPTPPEPTSPAPTPTPVETADTP